MTNSPIVNATGFANATVTNTTSVSCIPNVPLSGSDFQINGRTIINGDFIVNGVDLAQTLRTIQDRLAILVPDPKKLEKYEALKAAYNHYKMLEQLLGDNPE